MMASILIVDDEENIRKSLSEIFDDQGYSVECAGDGEQALQKVKQQRPDAVLLDIKLPRMDGLDVLQKIKQSTVDCEVVMITGHGCVDSAVSALKKGAFHFLQKPLSMLEVKQITAHAVHVKQQRDTLNELHRQQEEKYTIIGSSPEITRVEQQIDQIAPSGARVLITGESGTGKELVAYALHRKSPRAGKPFIRINCAAIPKDLIESELFGHEKGAFTGAVHTKKGKFELAHTGTLFLDEIGDMDYTTQTKVLRVLQEGELQRVGGTHTITVDVRVISATNRELQQMVRDGSFREDLYYRLCVVPIHVPSLAERTTDIGQLAQFFIDRYCRENSLPEKKLTDDAHTLLCSYQYPGNIRQLRNIIERIAILAPETTVDASRIKRILEPSSEAMPVDLFTTSRSLAQAKEELEREYVSRQLELYHWDIARTAEVLGVQRTNLHRKIKQLNIEKPLR